MIMTEEHCYHVSALDHGVKLTVGIIWRARRFTERTLCVLRKGIELAVIRFGELFFRLCYSFRI